MTKKVGRVELLMWLNELLQLSYVKIEEAGSGAAYCQIIDSIYGDVPLSKVKFNTTLAHEFIGNYKILQLSFDKHKINKEIPIERLTKRLFADNYEFLCWMKGYWEDHFEGGTYNAQELRELTSRPGSRIQSPRIGLGVTSISNTPFGRGKPLSPRATNIKDSKRRITSPIGHSNFGTSPLLHRTHTNVTELMKNVTRIEGERDYYYTKLREVESLYNELLSSNPSTEVVGVLDRLQLILFSQETASERAMQSPPISTQNTPYEDHSSGLPNMLASLSLDETLKLGAAEVDETETF